MKSNFDAGGQGGANAASRGMASRLAQVFLACVVNSMGCNPNPPVSPAPQWTSDRAKPAWIAAAADLFQRNRPLRGQRINDAIARVHFEFTRLRKYSRFGMDRYTGEPRSETRYVRIRRIGNEIAFLPHCTVRDQQRLLDELGAMGPWLLEQGTIATGQLLRLRNTYGEQLTARLEYYHPAELSAEQDWEDWLYARSLTTAYVREQGYFVSLDGPWSAPEDAGLEVAEAELATKGSPLALFLPVAQCRASWMSREHCDRRQLLDEVDTGSWSFFCGRQGMLEFPEPNDTAGQFTLRWTRQELEAYGVIVERLLTGAVLTAFGHHVPQVSVALVSRLVKQLGMQAPMRNRFLAIAGDQERSWGNRFRAKVMVSYIDGEFDDARSNETTYRHLGAQIREFVRSEAPTDENARELDIGCALYLAGAADWGCITG